MSAPAIKLRPAPISTIALTFESALPRSTASMIPSRTPGPSAFTGGLSTVITATPSCTSYRTTFPSLIAVPHESASISSSRLRATPLLCRDRRFPDKLAPFRDLSPDVIRELLGIQVAGLERLRREALGDIAPGQHFDKLAVQARDDVARRRRRREHTEEPHDFEAWQPRIGHRGDAGNGGRRLERRHGNGAELPGLYETLRCRHVREHHPQGAGHDVDQRRSLAFVGHVHDLDVTRDSEQLTGEMRCGAEPARTVIELARPGAGQREQLLYRPHRH